MTQTVIKDVQIQAHLIRRWCRKHFAKYLSLAATPFSADLSSVCAGLVPTGITVGLSTICRSFAPAATNPDRVGKAVT